MEVQQELDRFTQDGQYLEEHREELLRQYSQHWRAICNQQVVGAAKDTKVLVEQLKRKGILPGQTYWRWLSAEDELWILVARAR